MTNDSDLARDLITRSDELRDSTVLEVTPLAGDMSTRRFCRVSLANAPVKSVILILLSQAPGPVGGGPRGLTQDDTYVEVGTYLACHGVRVPKLFVDGRDRHALIVEDIGGYSLLSVTQGTSDFDVSAVAGDPIKALYAKALDIQNKLKALPKDDACVIFQRRTTDEQRAKQIREFLDYYATPRGLSSEARAIVEQLMDTVCARVAAHPLQVSHFDFMASNIHVLPHGELCLIDFQDMCLDSPARDIVSLLNDRDSDSTLGKERQAALLNHFLIKVNTHQNFRNLYDEYLLLWDFRVSGRFALLAHQRGLSNYEKWIPGTLRRLGRTLERAKDTISSAADALTVLAPFSEYIREGRDDPWEFPSY